MQHRLGVLTKSVFRGELGLEGAKSRCFSGFVLLLAQSSPTELW